jgi:hypothetical protein
MNPLFSVGEVVILQSVSEPDKNGEYTVIGQYVGSHSFTKEPCLVYELDMVASACTYWTESALRKKHQPGEQSFTELMQTLKSPVSV